MSPPLTVMLVAAEASGDDRGAGLARALKRRLGETVRLVGVGGERMAEEGSDSHFNSAEISILGLVEGLLAYRRIVRRVNDTIALAERENPDVVVLIDSWGFTLRVAQKLRLRKPAPLIIKYVGPQVWATRPGRAKTLAATVDHLLSIHAFDAPFFEAEGLLVTFVGNSALTVDFSGADPDRLRRAIGPARQSARRDSEDVWAFRRRGAAIEGDAPQPAGGCPSRADRGRSGQIPGLGLVR